MARARAELAGEMAGKAGARYKEAHIGNGSHWGWIGELLLSILSNRKRHDIKKLSLWPSNGQKCTWVLVDRHGRTKTSGHCLPLDQTPVCMQWHERGGGEPSEKLKFQYNLEGPPHLISDSRVAKPVLHCGAQSGMDEGGGGEEVENFPPSPSLAAPTSSQLSLSWLYCAAGSNFLARSPTRNFMVSQIFHG